MTPFAAMLRLKVLLPQRDPFYLSVSKEGTFRDFKMEVCRNKQLDPAEYIYSEDLHGVDESGRLTKLTNNQPIFFDRVVKGNDELITQSILSGQQVHRDFYRSERSPLLVSIRVNGIRCIALVDTGADTCVASYDFLRRVQLTEILDRQGAGRCYGIGQTKMLGVVHNCPIQVDAKVYGTPLNVIEEFGTEDGTELLIGLDFLKRNKCLIDLVDNTMKFDNAIIPFIERRYIESVDSLVENFKCSARVAYQAIKSSHGSIDRAAELILGI